ncbi:type II toxin-antitoxin system VapC family toxin [Nostocoides sp.]|uniref:type II toxin-antitoxin system VapC family toxin n=1 Tax=Nostocoides sp. TaxID=1917966 RepID=UPI003BB17744
MLDVTPPIVKKAAEFRRNRRPKKLPDAIHLATAVLNKCDWLVTFDDDFPDVDGLRTFRWPQLRDPQIDLPWIVAVQDPLFPDPNDVASSVSTHP